MCDLKPTVWFLQETKRNHNQSGLKSENLQNYQIFELKRQMTKHEGGKGWRGGGLAIGALPDVMPVLINQGDDNCECLTVRVQIGPMTVVCVVGYGPQLCDSPERKQNFWNYLEQDVQFAHENNAGIVIQIDSNSWAGKELVPNDPNIQNTNGKLLEMFLERNPNITIVNSLSLCSGLITRKRVTHVRTEESVLDLFLVCDKILPFVTSINVDEQGTHKLTNFNGIRNNSKLTESDHAILELHLDLEFPIIKPVRKEFFNFKNIEGQYKFIQITQNSKKLSECFADGTPYHIQFNKWQHTLNSIVVQCFPKIRTRKRKFIDTECGQMFEKRKLLKLELTENDNQDIRSKLDNIELDIARKIDGQFRSKIQNTLGHITGDDGAINTNGMWSLKNSLLPKHTSRNLMAIKDSKGNLVTSPSGIKHFCLTEIMTRLRNRRIHPDLIQLQFLKETLCRKRLKLASHRKSKHWNIKELEKVLVSLKSGRCRDPQGYVNEIFKSGGHDLKHSILKMLNLTKDRMEIPNSMKNVNIAMIPKPGKGASNSISNQRGIFILSIFRSILMKILLKDKYQMIDDYMSDSNVGGRKGRRIQDQLFVINGIVFDHARAKNKKSITIGIYDYRLCFDSMWQAEVINDLFDAGVQDDKLALLYEINKINKVAVNTADGLSE